MPPNRHIDWHELMAESAPAAAPDSRRRLRRLLAVVAVAAGLVLARGVQLELTGGAAFRAAAARPITRNRTLRADRGRILARDGTVLAADAHCTALAVHYRWFEEPIDRTWLKRQAAGALNRKQRRDPARLRAAEAELIARRNELHRRLIELCGLTDSDWQARCERVQSRVSRLAERVNHRRLERFQSAADQAALETRSPASWLDSIAAALAELFAAEPAAPPAPVVLAEQLEFHPLVEAMSPDIAAEIAAEIAAHPDDYRGVRIVELAEREYPAGGLAAHVVGHLGPAGDDASPVQGGGANAGQAGDGRARVGRMGVERQFESVLCGMPGLDVERLDHRARPLGVEHRRAPSPGQDVRLALDPALERSAEALLDQACRARPAGSAVPSMTTPSTAIPSTAARAASTSAGAAPIGGAAVLMDVDSGELLVAASAPRFAPQSFAAGDARALAALLAAPNHPLVDRVSKMALPPGSVFKTLAAMALLETGICEPDVEFHCQGYLHEPDRQRCLIFRRQGIGHGDLALAGALAQSCNVYFQHHAGELGPEPLIWWAKRFGFGRPTGVDLPDEAAGNLPHSSPDDPRAERLGLAQSLSIGQGTLAVTPLQVARLMAAVANGGRLVKPRMTIAAAAGFDASRAAERSTPPSGPSADAESIRLAPATLAAVREGLRRTVADPEGTAYSSARLATVAIAGKTGTAETAAADHAWFAGYAPADEPRVAVVVVLEHGGSAADAARIARELIARMHRQNYFSGVGRSEIAGE
jgi:penicillin-binding protein 2